jgi:hypothetical protein
MAKQEQLVLQLVLPSSKEIEESKARRDAAKVAKRAQDQVDFALKIRMHMLNTDNKNGHWEIVVPQECKDYAFIEQLEKANPDRSFQIKEFNGKDGYIHFLLSITNKTLADAKAV